MRRRYWGVLGLAAAGLLALALVAGGSLRAGTALAGQEDVRAGHGRYAQVFLDKLAALLQVDRDRLVGALKQAAGQTVDEAVASGDLPQQKADRIKGRIESGGFPGFFGGHGWGRQGHHGLKGIVDGQAVFAAVAQRLGMTADQLQSELKSGKSPQQIAAEHGVSLEDVKQTVLTAVQPQLDRAVQDGRITEQQRDRILEQIRQADGMKALGMHGGMKGPKGQQRPAPGN